MSAAMASTSNSLSLILVTHDIIDLYYDIIDVRGADMPLHLTLVTGPGSIPAGMYWRLTRWKRRRTREERVREEEEEKKKTHFALSFLNFSL